jgi:ribosome-associated protein
MQQLELRLNSDYVELNQLLKLTGICDSGALAKRWSPAASYQLTAKWSCAKPARSRRDKKLPSATC